MSPALRSLTWLLLLGPATAACGGIAQEPTDSGPTPGNECGELGGTKPAGDGCGNTCTCTEEGWSCTAVACFPHDGPLDAPCSEGDRLADGCNSCTCSANGSWQCTLIGCSEAPSCPWRETVPDDCNTCSCTEDGWVCTERTCDPPVEPLLCEEGAVTNEFCMRCVCEHGAWSCMALICGIEEPTCELEDTDACAEGEFCDFQRCGQDSEAGGCRTRPTSCPEEFAPVCGCDSVTYANECEARAAGVNAASEGECPAP